MKPFRWIVRLQFLILALSFAGTCLYSQIVQRPPSGPFRMGVHRNGTVNKRKPHPNIPETGNIHTSPPGGEQAAALSENTKGSSQAKAAQPKAKAHMAPLPPLYGRVVGRLIRFAPGGIVLHRGPMEQDFMKLGALVHQGDVLTTGGEGRAQIRFERGLEINLGPHTSLNVKDSNSGGREVRLDLLGGQLSTPLTAKPQDGKFEVKSSTAMVEGSGRLEIYGSPRLTYVCTAGGEAKVSNDNADVGGALRLKPGECARVAANGAPQLARNSPKLIREILKATDTSKVPDDDLAFVARRLTFR